MSYFLHIETSTNVCSCCLSETDKLLNYKEIKEENVHAQKITVLIEELFKDSKFNPKMLSAISVSIGPGSFTGLRIGLSVAKGMCYGLNIPLIVINTLQIMSFAVIEKYSHTLTNQLLCPMIDARRMEVYFTLTNTEGDLIHKTNNKIIDTDSFSNFLLNNKILFFGNGSDKCKDVITNSNATYIENIYPSAQYMCKLANKAFLENKFEDIAYCEPFYLKDFVTTTPKRKVI